MLTYRLLLGVATTAFVMSLFSLSQPIPVIDGPYITPSQITAPANFPRVRLTAVHDGDTLTGDILFPFGVALLSESIRCDGYDAWEISRGRGGVVVTDAELQKGKIARDAFTDLLKSADAVLAVPGKGDRSFGRLIAKIYIVKGEKIIDVAEWMDDHGHTRE